MKLSVFLLTFAAISASSSQVPNDEFLKQAAAQLDRLSQYKNVKLETNDLLEPIPKYESLRTRSRNEENKGDTHKNKDSEQEILLNEDAMRRIDELATNAYKLYNDPNYEAIMRERIKRGSGSGDFISGIAGKVLSGVTGLSGGSSGGGHAYDSYGAPVQPYHKSLTIWDFKKAILNTLIQAVKAIAGGAIAFKGHLIKSGGFIVQTGGRVISSAGEAAASLGSSLTNSALIAQSQPAYGPPAGYSYNPPPQQDYSYDALPPSQDSYQPEGYNNGHYNSANDGPADEPGLLLIKPTKATQPQLHQEDPRNNANSYQPETEQLPLEPPPSKTAQLTKLIGLITGTSGPLIDHNNNYHDNSHNNNNYNDNNNNYGPEHKDQDQPTANTNVINQQPNYQNDPPNYQSSAVSQTYGNPGYTTELATQQIQSLLNPYLGVPINGPTTFKEQSYNYATPVDSNAFNVPILGHIVNNNNNDINIDAVSASVGTSGYANPNFEIVPSVQVADWSRSILLPGSNARGHKKYHRRHIYGNNDNRYLNTNKFSNKRSKVYFMF